MATIVTSALERWRSIARCALAIAVVTGCTGPTVSTATPPGYVTRTQFGAAWPLTVDSGVLRCEGGAIVFRAPDGHDYGVNGLAATYDDIGPIWAAEPKGITRKMNIGPLIEAGQKLC